jgi:hypothetical protein
MEASLHEKARRVQCGMRRTRMIDSHQRPVVEAHHKIAGGGDAAHAIKRKPAGKGDDNTKGEKKLVANRHRNFPGELPIN